MNPVCAKMFTLMRGGPRFVEFALIGSSGTAALCTALWMRAAGLAVAVVEGSQYRALSVLIDTALLEADA